MDPADFEKVPTSVVLLSPCTAAVSNPDKGIQEFIKLATQLPFLSISMASQTVKSPGIFVKNFDTKDLFL